MTGNGQLVVDREAQAAGGTGGSSTRPDPYTVEELNLAIGSAATAWLQSGAGGDSPEAFALRDAARVVLDIRDERSFPSEPNRYPERSADSDSNIALLAGCSVAPVPGGPNGWNCVDRPVISRSSR